MFDFDEKNGHDDSFNARNNLGYFGNRKRMSIRTGTELYTNSFTEKTGVMFGLHVKYWHVPFCYQRSSFSDMKSFPVVLNSVPFSTGKGLISKRR